MRLFLLLLALATLAGCGDDQPMRVWQPSDHGQPPEAQVQPGRMPSQTAPQAAESPAEARARATAALWRVSCTRCHGPDGGGNGPEAPPGIPNMADPAWQAQYNDAELAAAIRQGKGEMPAFGDKINPSGIQALVQHVRSLANQPTP